MPPRSQRTPTLALLRALETRVQACESQLQALSQVRSSYCIPPCTTLGMNNIDFHSSQWFDVPANAEPHSIVLGAGVVGPVDLNHNDASGGCAGAHARIAVQHTNNYNDTFGGWAAAQHDFEDQPVFGNGVNTYITSNVQSFGVEPTNSMFDNAATFTPAVATSLPSVSVPSTLVTARAAATPRVRCAICGKTFGRAQELRRHESRHKQNPTRYACPRQGCKFSGPNGMLRKDKLKEHRDAHGH
ncbi:hypothetical protein N431DRAFT_433783 [Stipitochalara longipes BDJ]|nr:hypothetical protein N431DRAFT_433783 [Stipitochalara longipes BDJ]